MTSDGGGSSYTYSYDNKMLTAPNASLQYDAQDRLYNYTANSVSTRFVYDGNDLIAEYDSNGAMLRRYVHGPGSNEPLVWYEGSGTSTKRFFVSDERGSIAAVTDNAGNALAINTYNE